MSILKNIHITENFRFLFFLNIITIIILIWIYNPHDDVHTYGITIENINKKGNSLSICFKRYLAESGGETEIDKAVLYKNSPYNFENNGTSNYDENVSIYGNMKNRDSIKLKLYKISYKHRHTKKKGLSKLDCYCEGKIFNRIDEINKLVKNMGNDKNNFKKILHKKYGLKFTLSCLFTLIGIIVSSIYYGCGGNTEYSDIELGTIKIPGEGALPVIGILIILNFIILSGIIYIIIKIIKYEKLKAAKGKMSVMEYCRFCKDIF
ncbi:hypothetical protein PVNG_05965 [Plasmodium vivax North Korean]|uniref:Uncharacterized protein n=1 Tax=Plasmodium vivax North Korean TaxID=1035514 RepID=A0A0J9U0P2_PLAVI|nr:hypothetical protein PVNG_05965 [Plasmodium vivax North Korean]